MIFGGCSKSPERRKTWTTTSDSLPKKPTQGQIFRDRDNNSWGFNFTKMKVYLVRKFYSFGQPKFIIYFYAKCGDLKHVNLDLIKNNEDIDNYFKSYYGELNDTIQIAISLISSPYKRLGKSIRFSESYNVRSERTGQHFEDYNSSYVKVIDIPSEILLEKFKAKNLSPEHIQIFAKKNQFKLLKYMRYKWIEKNGLEIMDPKD